MLGNNTTQTEFKNFSKKETLSQIINLLFEKALRGELKQSGLNKLELLSFFRDRSERRNSKKTINYSQGANYTSNL